MFFVLPIDVYYLVKVAPSQTSEKPYYLQAEYDGYTGTQLYDFLSYSTQRIALLLNLVHWIILYLTLT